jgi:hypothetical protein
MHDNVVPIDRLDGLGGSDSNTAKSCDVLAARYEIRCLDYFILGGSAVEQLMYHSEVENGSYTEAHPKRSRL